MTWTPVRPGLPGHRGAAISGPQHDRRAGPTDAAQDDDAEPDETEEIEVLGTQLTREDQPSVSGPLATGVPLTVVLAADATAGGALWGRHS